MPTLNTTSYVVLGLLAERDWSAYEIAEQIGLGVTELWPRATRGLYDVPKRLVEGGFATSETTKIGQRPRTVYSITDDGRRVLAEWLATPSLPSALAFEGMIRVLIANEGSLADLRANLTTMAEQAREKRNLFIEHAHTMLEHEGGTYPERLHLMAMGNRFMVGHYTHIIEWAEWASAEVSAWDDTVSPAQSRRAASRAALMWSLAHEDPTTEEPGASV